MFTELLFCHVVSQTQRPRAAQRNADYVGVQAIVKAQKARRPRRKPLVYVKALFQPAAGFELIESTTVAVINGALAARAQAATAAYRANVVERQKK